MRALSIGLMVLGLMGIALVGGTSPAPSVNKVVIGVLDFEMAGEYLAWPPEEKKKVLMKDLRRNTRVKVVDIRESCGLSDLKRHGYERAERYKNMYQLDMILHTYITLPAVIETAWHAYFSLIDLYTKKVKEVSIETVGMPIEHGFRRISRKLLATGDIKRVLREKKEVLAKKEVTVPKEVVERPKEIEDLIQNGPTLIAKGEYNRVLELIEDLPSKSRKHVQIRTLVCFANLKGYLSDADKLKKLHWWTLRKELMDSGDNEATPMLTVLLRDNDPGVRKHAAELLGHIGDDRALNTLREVGENDGHFRVRRYAKWAYEQISGEKF